jgi:uncharacterized protein YndB with AHSA1/START domain
MSPTNVTADPGQPRVVVTREFDAPRELVYRCYTDPELLAQWLGPRRLRMRVDHFDLRHGGTWRYVHIDEDGTEYAFRGVFHGSPSADCIVQTFEFEGAPGHVSLDTAIFEEPREGRTRVRLTSVFQSVEDRDAMVASGMEQGIREGMDRLDELLARMPAAG